MTLNWANNLIFLIFSGQRQPGIRLGIDGAKDEYWEAPLPLDTRLAQMLLGAGKDGKTLENQNRIMVSAPGFEPGTLCLKGRCSTY